MSKAGKILFLFSFLFFTALLISRIAYGGWAPGMWGPLGISLLLFITGFVREFSAIKSFVTLRTTKHGMNMGMLIVLVFVGLVCANYFAVRFEKKFDLTSEGLFSLSEQTLKIVNALDKETEVILIYRPDQQTNEVKRGMTDLMDLYQSASKKIKFTMYDALRRPDMAEKFELIRGVPFAVYAAQGDKKVKVDPATEEGLTRALIRLGHAQNKVVYFTMGHGERALDDNSAVGVSALKEELEVTYEVKPLIFFQTGNKVPDDAAAVVVAGPEQSFLEVELQALREFARRGGKLLIAIDPARRHNLANLTKTFGVEFQNNHVLDRAMVERQFPTLAVGSQFSSESEVTKPFGAEAATVFELASTLKKAPDAPGSLKLDEIVRTHPETMSVNELTAQVVFQANGPHVMAISVTGKLPANGSEGEGQEFSAVIIGDSDFLSNSLIHNSSNRDLVANSIAWLTQDSKLISIRPKAPKGTQLNMTDMGFTTLVVLLLILLPLFMFSTAGLVWWRRRTA